MKKVRFPLIVLLSFFAAGAVVSGCGSSSAEPVTDGQSPKQQANALLTNFWTAVQDADTDTLEESLSPSWQLARADGTYLSRKAYINEVGSGQIDITDFKFDQIQATRSGPSLVIRYITTADYTLEGKKYKGTPAPYLGTFVWEDDRWQMASQANFNVPVD